MPRYGIEILSDKGSSSQPAPPVSENIYIGRSSGAEDGTRRRGFQVVPRSDEEEDTSRQEGVHGLNEVDEAHFDLSSHKFSSS